MVHIVEVRRDGEALATPMVQMQTWLDAARIQPTIFRMSLLPGGTIFRVEFMAASEAEAFARAFAGRVIRDARAGTIAA